MAALSLGVAVYCAHNTRSQPPLQTKQHSLLVNTVTRPFPLSVSVPLRRAFLWPRLSNARQRRDVDGGPLCIVCACPKDALSRGLVSTPQDNDTSPQHHTRTTVQRKRSHQKRAGSRPRVSPHISSLPSIWRTPNKNLSILAST